MIGDNIRAQRKKRKLTQVQLGEKIGVQGATVTRYENGVIVPNYDIIKSIAKALDTPVGELLDDDALADEEFTIFKQFQDYLDEIGLELLADENPEQYQIVSAERDTIAVEYRATLLQNFMEIMKKADEFKDDYITASLAGQYLK